MLWALAAAGGTGLLLGLWFRVAAIVAASGITAATSLLFGVFTDQGLMPTLVITFAFLFILQVGYLAGVMLSCAWSRVRLSRPDPPLGDDGEPLNRGKSRTR